jgi:hypothetical protein
MKRFLPLLVVLALFSGVSPASAQDLLSPIDPVSPVSQSLAASAMENSGSDDAATTGPPRELSGTTLTLIIGFSAGTPLLLFGGMRVLLVRDRRRRDRLDAQHHRRQ